MRIEATFKNCGMAPDLIDTKDKYENIISILWDEDIEFKENKYYINDAYFSGNVSEDYEYETEYLYNNIVNILDDFEKDIMYSEMIFTDGAGTVTAIFTENENNPMEQKVELIADWEINDTDNQKKSQNINQNTMQADKTTNNVMTYNIYENDYIYKGNLYPALKTIEIISESLSPAIKLKVLKEKIKLKEELLKSIKSKNQNEIER